MQSFTSSSWVPNKKLPWTAADGQTPSCPPEEAELPGSEWTWASNWRIDKSPGSTDSDGWEYARYAERFLCNDRATKVSRGWRDTSRRRKWSRVMRRDSRVGVTNEFQEAKPRIQNGLRAINAVRLRLEMIAKTAPEELRKDQMKNLVHSVRKNMQDTLELLVPLESGAGQKSSAAIKKLKNDLAKEEAAIDAIVKLSEDKSLEIESKSNQQVASASSPRPSPSSKRGSMRVQEREREKQSMSMENQQQRENVKSGTFNNLKSSRNDTDLGKEKKNPNANRVVSGGRNQPLNLGNLTKGNYDDEDGVFVRRTEQEQDILQKLVPIDEATVQAHIIEERAVAIDQIHKSLVEINDMFTDFSHLVKQQEGEVMTIVKNAEESNAKTEEAYNQILQAERLQRENCVIC